MSTPESATFDRRNFLASTAAGVGSALALIPLEIGTAQATEALTNLRAGNAGFTTENEQRCNGDQKCLQKANPGFRLLEDCIVAPFHEEIGFRVIPSFAADVASGFDYDTSAEAAIFGARAANLDRRANRTRRSFLVGALAGVLTTAEFAALHNFTAGKKFNTNFLPTPQAVGGGVFWALQRTFGAGANTICHMAHNSTLWFIQKMKK